MKATCAIRAAIARNASVASIELQKLVDLVARRLRRWIPRLVERGRSAERRNFNELAAGGCVLVHAERRDGRNDQSDCDQGCDQGRPLEPLHLAPSRSKASHERCERYRFKV